jgi:hypothetical protein
MEKIKDIKQNSSIFHKKAIFSKIKRLNSPIFDKNKIYNILLLNDNSNKNIKSQIIKIAKSSKLIGHNQTSIQQKTKLKYEINKYNEKNSIYQKKIKSITPYCSNESSKILNNTQKNIPFMPFSSRYSKGNSNDNIFGNKSNGNKINKNLTYKINLSKNSTDKKRKINLKINNIIRNMNNYKNNIHNNDIQKIIFDINKTSNKKNNFYSSKFSISLDNILSKKIKSKEKKNIILSKKIGQANKWAICSPRDNPINVNNRSKKYINNIQKITNTKKILEKSRKLYPCLRQKQSKIKTENMKEITNIINNINSTKKLINNNFNNNKNKQEKESQNSNIKKIKNKNKKNNIIIKNNNMKKKIFYSPRKTKNEKCNEYDISNYSRDSSCLMLGENCNNFNEPKIIGENNSTNDKSLNTNNKVQDSNKKKNCETPNIIINKHKNTVINKRKNNNYKKNKLKKNLLMDNDGFFTYEFDISNDNENINKINGVKTNNFDVKKPKEDNLKFTFFKDEKDSEISVSHASKIVIGNIDGYKDIIETDIKNKENCLSKYYGGVINKRINLFNNAYNNNVYGDQADYSFNNIKNKDSDLSALLRRESEPFILNEYNNIYDSFNMTNNIDGISSKITNNILCDNKKQSSLKNYNNGNNNINEDLYKVSFDVIQDNNNIKDSKIDSYSKIKSNNKLEVMSNNNINKLIYNNDAINNNYKNDKVKKKEEVNIFCSIF